MRSDDLEIFVMNCCVARIRCCGCRFLFDISQSNPLGGRLRVYNGGLFPIVKVGIIRLAGARDCRLSKGASIPILPYHRHAKPAIFAVGTRSSHRKLWRRNGLGARKIYGDYDGAGAVWKDLS